MPKFACRKCEEVRPVLPINGGAGHELDVELVHESCRLKRMFFPLKAHVVARKSAQLRVEPVDYLLPGFRVPTPPLLEKACDLGRDRQLPYRFPDTSIV